MDLESRLTKLRANGQQSLFEFLKTDLELGFTFARLCETEGGFDEPASKKALLLGEQVIEAVKYFRHRLESASHVQVIDAGLAELERRLAALR